MKVLVAVKRVVDYNVKVRVKSDNTGVDIANVKMALFRRSSSSLAASRNAQKLCAPPWPLAQTALFWLKPLKNYNR
jgi:hypothetical protein